MANTKETVGFLGTAIVLHGWSYTTEKWGPFINGLKKAGFEVVFPKVPGLTQPTNKVLTLDDYVAWLTKIVGRSKQPLYLIGHSNGGRIALAYTSVYQEKITGLVLIDSAGVSSQNLARRLKKFIFGSLAKIGKPLSGVSVVRNLFYKVLGEEDYNQANPIMKKTIVNLMSMDLTSKLEKIKLPTLIIWGRLDKITPLSDGQKLNQLIKNSSFSVIEEARHSPQFSNPQQVIGTIIKFVKNLSWYESKYS